MSDVLEMLHHVDPAVLDYQDWLAVGMALKHEGLSPWDWDAWSQRDAKRYRPGECERKWAGFNGAATPVTAGTLAELAKQQGWRPPRPEGRAFEWDDEIGGGANDLQIIDPGWVQDVEVETPGDDWNPARQMVDYLSALFESSDYVGYVTEAWQDDTRWLPKKGSYTRTAGELIHALRSCHGDVGAVLGDYNPEAGAWVRFNPIDGKGVRDENVTAYRYALVESDTLGIERQAAIYAELELPIAALVHSGKKSLHAIVRVGATSKEEYRERVNFLYDVCKKNGLQIDAQNKNPSRLSRLPGVIRNGQKQHLVAVNQGKASWEEWRNWIEEANDNLPDIESLADKWHDLPPLAHPLIDGLLRQGHKMLLAGPSKAGKSYILLQLAMSIAEGRPWLGWPCSQGKVLYVNLELDKPSCLHRLKSLYEANGWTPRHVADIDLWHLRGNSEPMDRLAPKLIRRALKKRYAAVIIDPIYKVITGDENAADKMAHFCNQFDRVCAELGSAVIYCHHHSKGSQGQKNARDRSSGSGVFARDPDAILDLIELNIEGPRRKTLEDREVCGALRSVLDRTVKNWDDEIDQDTAVTAGKFAKAAEQFLSQEAIDLCVGQAKAKAANVSGWRMEGTLREFPPFPPKAFWFRYPIHVDDADGLLRDAKADGEEPPWAAGQRERKAKQQEKKAKGKAGLQQAFEALSLDPEACTVDAIAEYLGASGDDVVTWIGKQGPLAVGDDGVVRTFDAAWELRFRDAFATVAKRDGVVKANAMATEIGCSRDTIRGRCKRLESAFRWNDGIIIERAD